MMHMIKKAGFIGLGSVVLLIGSVTPAFADGATVLMGQSTGMSPEVRVEMVQSGTGKTLPVSQIALPAVEGKPGKEAPVDAKISKDEAIALARKELQISEDYKVSGVNYYGNNQGPGSLSEPSWNINFTKNVKDRHIGNVHVTLGADTGRLLNWGKYDNDPEKRAVFPPKADLQEAKEIAYKYLQNVCPEEMKQTRYNDMFERSFRTPLNGDISYMIRYDRTVNGIPYPNNGISVTVNGNGEIVGYQYQWDEKIKFEDASGTISLEEATAIIRKESKPVLSYVIPYQTNQESKPFPSYQLEVYPIEGKSGDKWTWGASVEESTDKTPLAESPLADKPNPEQPLNEDQAIEAVTSIIELPEGAQLEDVSYNEYQPPYQVSPSGNWNIRWKYGDKEDPKRILNIFAGVDAFTGQVRNYNKHDESLYGPYKTGNSEESTKFPFDEAKAKAVDLVKKAAPYYANQIYLQRAQKPDDSSGKYGFPAYQFHFKRAVDGIETQEGLNVTIHPDTGEILEFYSGISNAAYPERKPDVIDPEKARDILLSQYEVELQYVLKPQSPNGAYGMPYNIPYEKYKVMVAAGDIPAGTAAADMEGKLVYLPIFKNQWNSYDLLLDAVTGKWRQRSTGEEATLGKLQATDISGNPAEQALRLMVEYRALELKDGKVNPEQVITRGEMIKMLMIAMSGGHFPYRYDSAKAATFGDVANGSTYFAYIESAADQNLIDRNQKTFRPEDPLTREDLAELVVRALGYNQLAGQEELFRLDVSDADQITRKGHAAIVTGLGIIPALDGKFAPEANVTRADAAAAFYRYLEKRASLQERQGYYGY